MREMNIFSLGERSCLLSSSAILSAADFLPLLDSTEGGGLVESTLPVDSLDPPAPLDRLCACKMWWDVKTGASSEALSRVDRPMAIEAFRRTDERGRTVDRWGLSCALQNAMSEHKQLINNTD